MILTRRGVVHPSPALLGEAADRRFSSISPFTPIGGYSILLFVLKAARKLITREGRGKAYYSFS